ncbi:GNAT family N-acetyltransferase [Niallia taxi]|uniref:GNAT family N-acetyltransferase n=1 Tax=Niallia taxi TaxID=2499688 RepID=UPI003CCC4AFE
MGTIDVRGNKERMHIDKVFITPSKQNKSTGTMAIQFLEKQFSDVKLWTLYTPSLSFRNHYFYEKFGYKKPKRYSLRKD